MNVFRIDLPWPASTLSPNARNHWSKLAKARAASKDAAFFTARAAGATEFPGKADATYGLAVIARPPDARTRDEDNIKACLKGSIDGMMFALGIDDSRIKDSHTFMKAPVKYGQITMVLTEFMAGKPWVCLECGHQIGTVLKKSSGSAVLRIQLAGMYAEIDSGLVLCPICGHQRKWVLGEERIGELIKSVRHYNRK